MSRPVRSVLRIASAGTPATLNPLVHEGKSLATGFVMAPVLHALSTVDASGSYQPQLLAAPPKPRDDGIAWHYVLRADRRWHDGQPVTSDDVAFSLGLMLDESNGIPERDGYELVNRLEIVSPREFVVHFSEAYSAPCDLFTSTTGAIMPRHLLESEPFNGDWPTRVRPASGPFRIKEAHLDAVVLNRNPGFSAAPGLPTELHLVPLHPHDAVEALIDGRVDVIAPDPDATVITALDTANLPWHTAPGHQFEELLFRLPDPVLADPELRRAIAEAIDRDRLASVVPGGVRLDSLTRRPDQTDYVAAFATRFDPARALNRLRAAGYYLDGGELASREGRAVRLEILTGTGSALRVQLVQHIAAQLLAIGIRTSITRLEPAEALRRVTAGRFQLAVIGLAGNPDPLGHATCWASAGPNADPRIVHGQNYAGIRDGAIDQQLANAMTERNPAKRMRYFERIDARLFELMATLPLVVVPAFVAHARDVSGPAPYPYQSGLLWDVERWRVNDVLSMQTPTDARGGDR